MNLKEFCKQYGVPIELVKQFDAAGLLDNFKTEFKYDIYKKEAVCRLESCICLHSLGLDVMTIKEYIILEFSNKDTREERIQILQKHRKENLENIHKTKNLMDCIDCVLHEIKTNKF